MVGIEITISTFILCNSSFRHNILSSFLNKVENPQNGPSAKLVYEEGGVYAIYAKPCANN